MDHRRSTKDLTSLPDILAALSLLEEEEALVSTSLADLLQTNDSVDFALNNLRSLKPQLGQLRGEAAFLAGRVALTADTADRVGGRVRSLDEQMRRVREANERVSQVLELKSLLSSLNDATDKADWETATRLCAGVMALPHEVICGVFAEKAVPTSESPLPPSEALRSSRELLRDIFLKNFKHAARTKDAAAISRFFKLFPPIGWDEEGLEAYSTFAVDLIHSRAPTTSKTSSPLYYVTALTSLFESVCNVVDQHQPVVEKYYGPLRMLRVVESLMQECDVIVARLLDGWKEERTISRKLADSKATTFATTAPPMSSGRTPLVEDDASDAREIDQLLNEISALSLRYAAFRKFIVSNLEELSRAPSDTESDKRLSSMQLMENSICHRQFEELIEEHYIPLEVWYLRSAMAKAHRTAKIDVSVQPLISSVPDLVFYLLKSVLTRVINTGSLFAVRNCGRRIIDVLRTDYVEAIKHKMEDTFRTTSSSKTGGNMESETKMNFIVHLNDIQLSISHMERLITDMLGSGLISSNFMAADVQFVEDELRIFQNFCTKMKATLKFGIDQFFNQLIRPRLRTFLTDIYRDVTYVLDNDAYAAAVQHDVVRKRFAKSFEDVILGLKEAMADSTFRTIFEMITEALIRPWERFATSLKYTELGAIRFDHDIRSVVSYLTATTNYGDVREKFQKLLQISTLLNIDKDEDVEDFFSSSGIEWKFNLTDVRTIVDLRVESFNRS